MLWQQRGSSSVAISKNDGIEETSILQAGEIALISATKGAIASITQDRDHDRLLVITNAVYAHV